MADKFDLTIIGSGPGGYVCAIRAAQLGMKVALVEQWDTFGGTCLNVGCIPSKALLHASEMLHEANHKFASLGIKTTTELDLPTMQEHRKNTVTSNVQGIDYLVKKNKITPFQGLGTILGAGKVQVTPETGDPQTIDTTNIVIATGSESAPLPGVEVDEIKIVSSTGALELDKVPDHLVVVGAGVIGLELGSVWQRLGAKVTVVEFLDRIVPTLDKDVAKNYQRMLKKQGFVFKLGKKVTAVAEKGKLLNITIEPAKGGDAETIDADIVLVAIGRRPYTQGLGLAEAGVAVDERGRVITDAHLKTNIDGIYAIGDVVVGPMLAHKAEEEGVMVAEILAGQAGHVNYGVIPGVIYTSPEVASVGKTEEELKAAGIEYKVGKFPFSANGRAKAMLATEGFAKIIADAKTDQLLGAHIIGFGAGEMIHEAAVIMEFSGSAEDLARTCHAHPTMSEAVKEAALGVDGRSIHI